MPFLFVVSEPASPAHTDTLAQPRSKCSAGPLPAAHTIAKKHNQTNRVLWLHRGKAHLFL